MRKILPTLIFILHCCTFSWATAPSAIDMEYDAENKIFHVEVKHISHNMNKHYIRRLIVYKNDEEVGKFTYPKQTSPNGLIEDLPLEAKSGDIIRVSAICNEAGPSEETFTIP